MGFASTILPIVKVATGLFSIFSTAYGAYSQKRASDRAENAANQIPEVKSLAPPPLPTGPTASELEAQKQAQEAQKAKEAADQRAADLEASIKADTEAAALRKKSLIGLSSTVKTSSAGLTTAAPVQRKRLLGE